MKFRIPWWIRINPTPNSALRRIYDLLWFVLLTFLIHYTYRYWAYSADYKVFGINILPDELFNKMSLVVFYSVKWFLGSLLNISIYTQGIIIYMPDGGGVAITDGCSGFKQMVQFALLILLFPGPWKHKIWFIPLGVLIMHLSNLIRIIGLCFVMLDNPDLFDAFHQYLFRPMFYAVIFGLWVYWNEVIRPGKIILK